jgi:WD40 repeat protein
VPDHELIRRIGKGSYGEVWLARTQMGRFRAVKVVHGESSGREYAGLKNYEPISRSHPGLVAILHVGLSKAGDYFYYVMELADDRESGTDIDPVRYVPRILTAEAKENRLTVKECVELGIALADALQKLHSHGLLHRDIKPSNIIFVNGVPKLADIGLIADVAEAKSYVGTEGFVPPQGPNSPQSDIYSLGKVLYEISTGNDRTEFPKLPLDLAEAKKKDFLELNEVLIKACDADPEHRYKTAAEMQADLALLRGGESLLRLRRLERLVARSKKLAVAALLAAALLFLGYTQLEYRQQKAAEIRQLQLGGHLADGTYALNNGDFSGSLSAFLSAAMLDDAENTVRSRTHRLRLKQVLESCPKLVQIFFHTKMQVDHAEFSPSEDLVLTATVWGQAQLWDAHSGDPFSAPFASSNYLECASFNPNGKYVVTADNSGLVEVWTTKGESVLKVRTERPLDSARFNPDGNEIITGGGRGVAQIWEFPSGTLKHTLIEHKDELTHAGYSRDGRYLLTTARDSFAILWDAQSFKPIHKLPHRQWVHHGDISPDGRLLVTGCFDRQARLWDMQTGEQLYPEMPHGDGVYSTRFSNDGRFIVTACLDGIVRLWEVKTRQLIAANPMIRHGDRALDASFSSDGRRILVACGDGTARIWDFAGGASWLQPATNFYSASGRRLEIAGAQRIIPDLTIKGLSVPASNHVYPKYSLTRNGRFAMELKAIDTNQFEFRVWNIENGQPVSPAIRVATPEREMSACVSDDGRCALVYTRKTAQLYDLQSGKQRHSTLKPALNIAGAAFSPNGRWLSIYGSSTAVVVETESGNTPFQIPAYEGKVRFVDFSKDSRKMVVCTTSGGFEKCFAEIWDPENGTRLEKRFQHGDGVLMAAFSDDGTSLVTASEDFYATVWDPTTGQQMVPSLRHAHQVRCASFSHNGEWLVTASADRKVHLWDAATRKPLAPPMMIPVGMPLSVRFVGDDTAVVVTTEDGGAWLWRLKTETRPLEDLALLYELVCGRGDFEANRFRTTPQQRLKDAWKRFTRESPEDFKVSQTEILAWKP